NADARGGRAAEQQRLADRADRLEQSIKQLARGAQGVEEGERKALNDAAHEVERQRLAERMHKIARAARDGSGAEGQPREDGSEAKDAPKDAPKAAQPDDRAAAREGQEIARQLDRLPERPGTAHGNDEERPPHS